MKSGVGWSSSMRASTGSGLGSIRVLAEHLNTKPTISLSLDEVLTDEGLVMTMTATDDSGTQKTTVLLPWSDPKESEPQG